MNPLRASLAVALTVTTSLAAAQPVAVDFFSQSILLGMQLSVKHGERTGTVSPSQALCVQALKPSAFYDTVNNVIGTALNSGDLLEASRFLSTPVGQKYAEYGLLQIYSAVGEPLPRSLPSFSDTEYKQIEAFAATPSGQALIIKKVMQSVPAKRSYDIRIHELLEQCREK